MKITKLLRRVYYGVEHHAMHPDPMLIKVAKQEKGNAPQKCQRERKNGPDAIMVCKGFTG